MDYYLGLIPCPILEAESLLSPLPFKYPNPENKVVNPVAQYKGSKIVWSGCPNAKVDILAEITANCNTVLTYYIYKK